MYFILIFATGFLAAAFLMIAMTAEVQMTPRGRLGDLVGQRDLEIKPVWRGEEVRFAERVIHPFLRRLSRIAEGIGLARDARLIQEKLDMAGRPQLFGMSIGVREFIAIKLVSMTLAVVVFVTLMRHPLMGGMMGLVMTLLLTVIIFMAPTVIVDHMIDARKHDILKSFSDILDLLVVSAEAGLSLDAAMGRVADRRRGPLPSEFEIALHEMRLGKSRADTLRALARRTGVVEIKAFASAIIQAENLGVSIAQVLRTQAETNRERRSQRIREQAAKLATKMLFPMVFFIMPAIFVVMAAPGVIQTLRALSGTSH
jgi:tight adherence protein C